MPPTLRPERWSFNGYLTVFEQIPFLNQLWSSVLITVTNTAGVVATSAVAGYAFARMRFRGRSVLFGAIVSMLMVPTTLLLIPQFQTVQAFGWLNTTAGVVVPGIVSAFGIFLLRQVYLGLPVALEEAARIDGANPAQIFWFVILPLVRPALSALTILTVIVSWSSLLWPLIIMTSAQDMPLSVGIASFRGEHSTVYPAMLAASFMASVPTMIFFLLLQRRVLDGIAFSGLRG